MVKIAKISAVRRPHARALSPSLRRMLMVSEPVHELASYDLRCVSCGERIDPVILAHRRRMARISKARTSVPVRDNSLSGNPPAC